MSEKDFRVNDASIEGDLIWGLLNEGLFNCFSEGNVYFRSKRTTALFSESLHSFFPGDMHLEKNKHSLKCMKKRTRIHITLRYIR